MSADSDFIDKLVVKKLVMQPGVRVIANKQTGHGEFAVFCGHRGQVVKYSEKKRGMPRLKRGVSVRWMVAVRWDGIRHATLVDVDDIDLLGLVDRIGELE